MKKKYLVFCFVYLFYSNISIAQNVVEEFDLPTQSFIKFNKNLMNPSLSPFNYSAYEAVLYHRNQWSGVSDSPKTFLFSFNGNNYMNSGYGVSLYQKTVGVWKSVGAVGNYAKAIQLSENNFLSVGFNVVGFSSDLDRTKIITTNPDPLFEQYEKTTMVFVNPGVSLHLSRFNFGVYADNLVDYNFSTSKTQTPFADKTFSGHMMYTFAKSESDGIFENSEFSLLGRTKIAKDKDVEYSAGFLYNLPKAAWLQGTYNSLYGASAGVGFNLLSKIAIGYNYEKSFTDQLTNLGATHEFFIAYTFKDNEDNEPTYSKKAPAKKGLEKTKTLEQEEIRRYKKKVYEKDAVVDNKISKEKIDSFKKMADSEDINYLILPEKNGSVRKGYYLVTNVYSDKQTATNKLSELKKTGKKKSGIFTTASGEWNYVYLERFDKVEDAKKAYNSNYNNTYNDIIWVLPIL